MLSAFAKVRVRSATLLQDTTDYMASNEVFVRSMTFVDLLYAASSFARLGAKNHAVFPLIADAFLQHAGLAKTSVLDVWVAF